MASVYATFNGTNGSHYHTRLDFWEGTVDTANNRSYCYARLYIYSDGGYSYYGYGNQGYIYVNGNQWGSGNFGGTVNNTVNQVAAWEGWLGHDGNGDATWTCESTVDSGYCGHSQTWGQIGLTHINRYTNITAYTQTPTDVNTTLSISTDVTCDYISWWSSMINSGAHNDTAVTPGTGPFNVVVPNLASDTTYDFTMAVRRQDDQLWTNSTQANVTTLHQNNMFGVGSHYNV